MAKVYVATMHTGNTLTIHGHTFFKGRPTVITEPVLIDYLKTHPNFRLDEKIVSDAVKPVEAQASAVRRVKEDLREEGAYVAPAIFEETPKEATPAPKQAEEADSAVSETPASKPTTAARKGAVSAPRPTATK